MRSLLICLCKCMRVDGCVQSREAERKQEGDEHAQ